MPRNGESNGKSMEKSNGDRDYTEVTGVSDTLIYVLWA